LKILIRLKPVLRGLPILAFCATDATTIRMGDAWSDVFARSHRR